MKKTIIILGLAIFSLSPFTSHLSPLQAQETGVKHEVTLGVQGGLGSMPFKGPATWNDQPGLAIGAGVGYTYWFNQHWGIHAGLRLGRLNHNEKISNLDIPFSAQLPLSSLGMPGGSGTTTVNLRGTATSVQEERTYTFVELPIQAALKFDNLYFNLGISLAKAVGATGNYSYTDPGCYITELPDLGVVTTTPVPMTLDGVAERDVKNTDMVKPFYCLLAGEAGYRFPLGETTSLGLGVYGRFAPFAYKTDDPATVYGIQPDATYKVVQPSTNALVEKTGYYEVGLTLAVNLGLGRKSAKDEETEAVLAQVSNSVESSASEIAALKADRKKADDELAAVKAAQKKSEKEMDAVRAAMQKLEDELAALKAAPMPEAQKARAVAQKHLESINATVYFQTAGTKAQFDEQTDAAIHAICEAMKADPKLEVTVYGHADNTGTARANRKYGRKRAQALKNYMVQLGAPADNIKCVSKGDKEPVADNATKEGRALNRRATVEL